MQVLLLNDFAAVRGGSDQVALAEARGLAARGHQVTLWTAVGPVDPGLLGVPGLEVHCLGIQDILEDPQRLRAMARGLWNRTGAQALTRWLSGRDRHQIVAHVHGWSKGLTAAIFPVLHRAGLNPVVTMHDYFVVCPNGTFHDHQRNLACSRRPLGWSCVTTHCDSRAYAHKLWRVARHASQKWAGHVPGQIRHLISLSAHSEMVLRPCLPPDVRVHRLGNPVAMERHPKVAVRANRTITYLGRLAQEKGVLVLASAVAAGVEGTPPVVFAGDGELRGEILRRAPQVTVTGWLGRSEIEAVLEQTRVLVCPSVCHETFGLTAGEARARGIPVIVSDQCATREQVRHGIDGWHFRQGDAESLRGALREAMNDPVIEAYGQAAYDGYWAAPNGLNSHLDGLERIYAAIRQTSTRVGE